MGVLDKIKNALFEVEYVEVEEPEKKEKKPKIKEKQKLKQKEKDDVEKPIAKKIVLPGKKEEKVEKIQEEELKDDNFETRPKTEIVKQSSHDEFKFMDDNDFRMDDENLDPEEPEVLSVVNREEEQDFSVKKEKRRENRRSRDFYEEEEPVSVSEPVEKLPSHTDKYYNNGQRSGNVYSFERDSKPYGMDTSYKVPVHEYGTYEKKEEKSYFKPSPIISPIYGILDKNYKKEDVVQKKEIRLTTNFSRSNVSVDDVRNKAYGGRAHDDIEFEDTVETTFEVDDGEDDNLLVDLSDDSGKPEVKELTMGDALEYFQDLGLEYNVDYVDASKERTTPRRERESYDEIETLEKYDKPPVSEKTGEGDKSSVIEVMDESSGTNDDSSLDDDDNLFDLIDSMYQEN